MAIYEPAEDSYLLQKAVREYAFGRVLDMGTGSGIQALTAITYPNVREVVAVDMDQKAVENLQKKVKTEKLRKLNVIQSNLFENVAGCFNLIVFNPPYLPQDKGIADSSLYGGKKGWELSEKFFSQVSNYLFPDGKILFLFSSLTNKQKIEEILRQHLFQYQEIERQKLAFEELYVYTIEKTPLLRTLEGKGIETIYYIAKGKRGIIYRGLYNKGIKIKSHIPRRKAMIPIAIKVPNPQSEAVKRIEHEAGWLQKVNERGIGPRYLFFGENYLVYEFVEGKVIEEWIAGHSQKEIISVLLDVLQQCFILDSLRVNKEEMHHPQKHIIITANDKPVLLDFERCNITEHPKNVTQFVEYLCRLTRTLAGKGLTINTIQLRSLAREYKKDYHKEKLRAVEGMIRG